MRSQRRLAAAVLALYVSAGPQPALAQQREIAVSDIDTVVRNHPLPADGPTSAIVTTFSTGDAGLEVLVMSRTNVHHHTRQDHVLYLARGTGTAELETATGRMETRAIKPGDILVLPRGRKHGFVKTSAEDLVFLVVATGGASVPQDTIFAEQ